MVFAFFDRSLYKGFQSMFSGGGFGMASIVSKVPNVPRHPGRYRRSGSEARNSVRFDSLTKGCTNVEVWILRKLHPLVVQRQPHKTPNIKPLKGPVRFTPS